MIYFPQTPKERSWGSAIGEALGALAHGKAHQLQRRHEQSSYEEALKSFGYSEEDARRISKFDPQIVRDIVKGKIQGGNAEQQNKYLQETIGNIQRGYVETPAAQKVNQLSGAAPVAQNRLELASQQNPMMNALENLQRLPLENALNPQNMFTAGPNALQQLQNAPYEHLAQQLMNQQEQSKQVSPQPEQPPQEMERRPFTAADIKWENLTPQQALQVQNALNQQQLREEKQSQARESIELRKQAAIDKQVSPFLKESREGLQQTKEVVKLVDEALDLMKAPDIQLGSIKSLTPNRFQNASTQALVSKLNELVTKKAQLGKGVPSRMRLILEQASKPQIWQKPGAIQYILNSLKDSSSEAINKQSVINDVIAFNNGNNPKNLEHTVDKIMKIYPELPDTNGIKEGQKIKAGPFKFINEQGQWHYIGA